MLILQALQSPETVFVLLFTLIVGLTVHEYAHAWSAYRLGDPTAAFQGRLTLDPRKHLDPMGSIVFLLIGFGWAKPVPINPYSLGRRGVLWVALAGPVSNVLLASAVLLPLRAMGYSLAAIGLAIFGLLNLNLAVFNMLPVAPLDGWKVMMGIVPPATAWRLQQYEAYGPMVLLALIVMGQVLDFSPIGAVLGVVTDAGFRLLAGVTPDQAFSGDL